MSRYDDERPRRHKSQRERRSRYSSDDDDYSPPRHARPTSRDLVRSPRSPSVSSVEEVERDFPPGERGYQRTTKIRKGVRPTSRPPKGHRYHEEEDGYYSDPRGGGRKTNTKYYEDDKRSRRSRRAEYTPESSLSRSPPRRRKSLGDQALAALGIGGAAGALAGQKSKDHDRRDRHDRYDDRSRSRGGRRRGRRYSSSSRSRSRSAEGTDKIAQAVKAALTAGAAEAFRARKEPGGWTGTKGKRIITAAVSAGGVDKLMDKDPDKHGKRNVIGSALAGLATNRIVNGPRSRSRSRGRGKDGKHRRARSESRGGGGFGDLAAGGILAAAGKKIFDTVRDKSRGRGRSRSSSVSSDDRKGTKKRSRSVSAFAGRGLAALGLKDAADKVDRGRNRAYSSSSSEDDYDYRPNRARGGKAAYADSRNRDVSAPPPPITSQDMRRRSQSRNGDEYSLRAPHHYGDPETDSDSDLGSSSEEDKSYKKHRGKEVITAGLASIATIHAAHNLHQSMQAREERQKKLYTGEITPEEARKAKNKARFQDAASIGIAALGVKGAISEWKEVKEKREESHELHQKIIRHKKKRDARRRKQEQLGQSIYHSSEPALPTNSSMMTTAHNGPHFNNPFSPPPGAGMHDPYRPMSSAAPGTMYMDGNPYAAGGLPPSPGLDPGPGPHGMPPPPGPMPGPPPGSYFPPPPPGPPPPR